jgi:hypothetical protein
MTLINRRPIRAALALLLLPLPLLAAGLAFNVASADPAPTFQTGEQLHAQALAQLREGRLADAYGRFVALAESGHAPAARMALWMCENGRSALGHDWDCAPHQVAQWAALAGVAAPVIGVQQYPALQVPAQSGAVARPPRQTARGS